MTFSDIFFICLLFFIIGFVFAAIGLLFCRIKYRFRRKGKSFHQPAKFVPELDLQYEKVQASVDNSTAADDFVRS